MGVLLPFGAALLGNGLLLSVLCTTPVHADDGRVFVAGGILRLSGTSLLLNLTVVNVVVLMALYLVAPELDLGGTPGVVLYAGIVAFLEAVFWGVLSLLKSAWLRAQQGGETK